MQVNPAQGRWRKFPGLRTVTLQDSKTWFACRRCNGLSQFLNSSHDFSLLVNLSQQPSSLSSFSTLLDSLFISFPSSQLVLTRLTSVPLVQFFLNLVEVTQLQTCSIAVPFARSVWLVQVLFVLFQGILPSVKRKSSAPNFAAKAPFATFMQPLQYDLRFSAAKHNNIPRAAAVARNLDAAIPLRSAESAKTAKHKSTGQQGRAKVTWNPPFHCARRSNRNRRTPATVAQASQLFSTTEPTSAYPQILTMFRANPNVQIASMIWQCECDLLKATCKTQSESQDDATEEQVSFKQPWRSHSTAICTDSNCKTSKHSVNKEKKKWPGTLSSTARADRTGIDGKAATPATVTHASQLFSATEPPFNRKNTIFRANPNIQIASLM